MNRMPSWTWQYSKHWPPPHNAFLEEHMVQETISEHERYENGVINRLTQKNTGTMCTFVLLGFKRSIPGGSTTYADIKTSQS